MSILGLALAALLCLRPAMAREPLGEAEREALDAIALEMVGGAKIENIPYSYNAALVPLGSGEAAILYQNSRGAYGLARVDMYEDRVLWRQAAEEWPGERPPGRWKDAAASTLAAHTLDLDGPEQNRYRSFSRRHLQGPPTGGCSRSSTSSAAWGPGSGGRC